MTARQTLKNYAGYSQPKPNTPSPALQPPNRNAPRCHTSDPACRNWPSFCLWLWLRFLRQHPLPDCYRLNHDCLALPIAILDIIRNGFPATFQSFETWFRSLPVKRNSLPVSWESFPAKPEDGLMTPPSFPVASESLALKPEDYPTTWEDYRTTPEDNATPSESFPASSESFPTKPEDYATKEESFETSWGSLETGQKGLETRFLGDLGQKRLKLTRPMPGAPAPDTVVRSLEGGARRWRLLLWCSQWYLVYDAATPGG